MMCPIALFVSIFYPNKNQNADGHKTWKGKVMKKTIKIVFLMCVMLLVSALMFTACGNNNTHTDNNQLNNSNGREQTTSSSDEQTTIEDGGKVPVSFSSGLAYEVNADGKTCTITGIGTCTDSVIYIGNYINGYKVVAIGVGAFSGCSNITEIKFAANSTITSIGDEAFKNCIKLVIIVIPEGVKAIGNSAFSGCIALTTVTIPVTVVFIGNSAFSSCGALKNFEYCGTQSDWDAIQKDTNWDDGVIIIIVFVKEDTNGDGSNDSGNADNDGNIQETDEYLKYKLSDDNAYYIITGIKDLKEFAEIKIPSEYNGKPVKEIGSSAFSGCGKLIKVTIPDSITSIGEKAFSNCNGLISITIGNNLESIDTDAFRGCCKLIEIHDYSDTIQVTMGSKNHGYLGYYALAVYTTIDEKGKLWTDSSGYIFYEDEDSCYLVSYKGREVELTLPITCNGKQYALYEFAFQNCESLKSVIVPNSITRIGASAFSRCNSLESIVLPFLGESIGVSKPLYYIFGWAETTYGAVLYTFIPNTLKSVTIRGGKINASAFQNCTSLQYVTMAEGITQIGSSAFKGCSNLINVTLPNGIVNIGDDVFRDCSSLTSIEIPDSVVRIGTYVFYGCSNLSKVTFGNVLQSIGSMAFYGCDSLMSVDITDLTVWCNVSFPDFYANPLYYAHNLYVNGELLTDAVIPNSVTSIGSYVFSNCDCLTSIKISSGVTSIGHDTFQGCSSLTSITIPDSVTSIGSSAFYDCSNLKSITFEGTVAQWNAISKGSSWDSRTGKYNIYCIDGEIAEDGTVTFN